MNKDIIWSFNPITEFLYYEISDMNGLKLVRIYYANLQLQTPIPKTTNYLRYPKSCRCQAPNCHHHRYEANPLEDIALWFCSL